MNIKKCVDLQTIELNKYINATPKVFGIVFWVERLIYVYCILNTEGNFKSFSLSNLDKSFDHYF